MAAVSEASAASNTAAVSEASAASNTAAVSEAPVVAITGAAGGVGAACASRFASGGWRVAGIDLQQPRHADMSLALAADVRAVDGCDRAIAACLERFARLDALVNAAGVWTEGDSEATTEAEWDRVIDTNLKGTFFMIRAALAPLRQRAGCIVNLSSDAGIQGNNGAAVYCASKGGVSILTKALALELAPAGVRVNAVCPGDIDTPMLAGQARDHGGGDPDGYLARLLAGYPQGPRARFVQPAEVAELIWFLCQPAAAAITGANVSIDFGLSAGVS